jgi:hypothetical protein
MLKSTLESGFYILFFGILLVVLALYILKHAKGFFVYVLARLDNYVIHYTNKETFQTLSIPSTPKLHAINSYYGSTIYFKIHPKDDIQGYIYTMRNTSNPSAPIHVKILSKTMADEADTIRQEVKEIKQGDVYQVHIKPFTKNNVGLPSNPVFVYKEMGNGGYDFTKTMNNEIDEFHFKEDYFRQR